MAIFDHLGLRNACTINMRVVIAQRQLKQQSVSWTARLNMKHSAAHSIKQEAQLSQRYRATLCHVNSGLGVTQRH